MVTPQTGRPLYSYDDACHALTGWAAVLVYGRVVVALANAGIFCVALDASPTGLGTVLPQSVLQDVMANGGAQVLPGRAVSWQQLMKGAQ